MLGVAVHSVPSVNVRQLMKHTVVSRISFPSAHSVGGRTLNDAALAVNPKT
jgi:hypothetical protein